MILKIPQLDAGYAKKKGITRLPYLQADQFNRFKRANYRKIWAGMVKASVWDQGGPPRKPWKHVTVRGIRYCTGVPPDRPNVWYSFKPLIDALNEFVIEDDNPSVIIEESYHSVRVEKKAQQRIVIIIDPLQYTPNE